MSRPESISVHVLSDDPTIREASRSVPDGYTVTFSVERTDALAAISRSADVAVIELDLGGYGITSEIRDRVRDRKVRVIMICSRAHDRWLCRQAGADEVLIKPLSDLTDLSKAITAVTQTQ